MKTNSDGYLRLAEVSAAVRQANTGTREWASYVRAEARELAAQIRRSYVRLSELIYHVYDAVIESAPDQPRLFEFWGYDSLYDWAESELGFNRRKVDFLKRIYYVLFVQLDDMDAAVRQRLCDLDYSKVREIVSVLTVDNAGKWAELGEAYKYSDLLAEITEYRKACRAAIEEAQSQGRLTHDEVNRTNIVEKAASMVEVPDPQETHAEVKRIPVYADQKEVIDRALDSAGAISGSRVRAVNLTHICADFLASNGAVTPGSDSLRNYLTLLERVLDIRLVAFERIDSGDGPPRAPRIYHNPKGLHDLLQALDDAFFEPEDT